MDTFYILFSCKSRNLFSSEEIPRSLYYPLVVTSLLLLCAGVIAPESVSGQSAVFVEEGGLIVIQAESLDPVGDWVEESSDAGYTGSGYIRWNGPNYYGTPDRSTLAYKIYINDPGEYNVRLRMSHKGAPAGDQWNDCWARMDNGPWAKALHPADKMNDGFTFDSILEPDFGVFESMRYYLSAGVHTLYISGRSENLRIDRLHFYRDYVSNPLNLSLPESARRDAPGTPEAPGERVDLTGELKQWHPVTLTVEGPEASEAGTPNPFLDYRFEVTFSQGPRQFTVPGFFAADGNAAETSSSQGNKWRAYFVPDATGIWNYEVSFREGPGVAVNTDPNAGSPTSPDGISGSFVVSETDKAAPDHRGKGMLRYIGEHYLRFDNGEYFLKGGANSPENFLSYGEFDGTYNSSGRDYIKSYSSHVQDWVPGDPTWQSGKGKGIIGAISYLASKGMNVVYFITMNVQGDGRDVWPWIAPEERVRFDISKLAQWNVVFDHMDRMGIMLHVQLQETENEMLLDGGALGIERKLYFRELIARFGYHHALTWNLGEENDENTDSQRKAFADYIRELDPYEHPIVIHTFPGQQDDVFEPLLGYQNFEGASLQVADMSDTWTNVATWRHRSRQAGRPWIVSLDEIGPYQLGVTEDGAGNNHDEVRQQALWPALMAGGAGVEWYFGSETASTDLSSENWRTRDNMWDYTRHALDFFQDHLPFVLMEPMDDLTSRSDDYVFAAPDTAIAVYLPEGDSLSVQLPEGTFSVQWYNPRTGGDLVSGDVQSVQGPGIERLGYPPGDASSDWVVLLRRTDGEPEEQHSGGFEEPSPLAVTGFVLVDADTDEDLRALNDDDVIDLGNVPPHLNVRAIIASDEGQRAEHVVLQVEEFGVRRKEAVPPFALFGDLGGDYLPGTFMQGTQVLTAIPYGLDGDPDQPGDALSISLTVTGANPATQATLPRGDTEEEVNSSFGDSRSGIESSAFQLNANFPNPFRSRTTIPFTVQESGPVRLVVYDMQGRQIRLLLDRVVQPGVHAVVFDATGLPSGTYVYRLDTPLQRLTRKMSVLK